MDIFAALSYFSYLAILAELLFSLSRKDGVYSLPGTIGNVMNGVVVKFLSVQFIGIYLSYFFLWRPDALDRNMQAPFALFPFIVCLLLVDFFYYIFHRLHHSFPFLWMFHFVHHGDNKLNLSTALRVSWAEQLYLVLFFTPILLVGFPSKVILLSFFCLAAYQFFCHGQYIQLPRFFDLALVTPHNHRIHHDQTFKNQMSNFGGMFSIWDRLFGTYVPHIDDFTSGIVGYQQDNFIKMQIDPIAEYAKKLFSRK